ncbi:hypothetical protein Q6247_26245, partial [Klebsiella pneumoniae]
MKEQRNSVNRGLRFSLTSSTESVISNGITHEQGVPMPSTSRVTDNMKKVVPDVPSPFFNKIEKE